MSYQLKCTIPQTAEAHLFKLAFDKLLTTVHCSCCYASLVLIICCTAATYNSPMMTMMNNKKSVKYPLTTKIFLKVS